MNNIRVVLFFISALALVFSSCKKDDTTGPASTGGAKTISGVVLSQYRTPVPGVPVYLLGKSPVTTDASGRFSITDVTPPYNIAVINTRTNEVYVFKGLTRSDPSLTFIDTFYDSSRVASYSGVIRGGTFPQPPNQVTRLLFESPATPMPSGGSSVNDSTFGTPLSWVGVNSTTGSVHTLQWETASGLPTTFKGYGSVANVPLTNGGGVTGGVINLTATHDTTSSGTITLPSGYALTSRDYGIRLGQNGAMLLGSDGSTSSSFSFVVPRNVGNSYFLRLSASGPSSTALFYFKNIIPGSSNAFSIPAGAQLTLPPTGTSNVDTNSIFSWTPVSGGVYLVYFDGSAGSSPNYWILTTDASTTLPNLGNIGFGLPASAGYVWSVYAFAPIADMDAATAASGFLLAASMAPPGDGGYSRTTTRTFTTRP